MTRKSKARPTQPENIVFDRTPARDKLAVDLDVAIVNAIEMGLSRINVIEELLHQAEKFCVIAKEHNEDQSVFEGLLS